MRYGSRLQPVDCANSWKSCRVVDVFQRLMDKELAIAAKEEEVSALGSHLQTAKGETALVEGRLAEALKDKEKAEARLGIPPPFCVKGFVVRLVLTECCVCVCFQRPWKPRS
jgi:hypothetical protein